MVFDDAEGIQEVSSQVIHFPGTPVLAMCWHRGFFVSIHKEIAMERILGTKCVSFRWKKPSNEVQQFVIDHLMYSSTVTRRQVARELLLIRREFPGNAAREYLDYLLWLGVYPLKRAVR